MRRVKTDLQHVKYHGSSNDANNRIYCSTSNSEAIRAGSEKLDHKGSVIDTKCNVYLLFGRNDCSTSVGAWMFVAVILISDLAAAAL